MLFIQVGCFTYFGLFCFNFFSTPLCCTMLSPQHSKQELRTSVGWAMLEMVVKPTMSEKRILTLSYFSKEACKLESERATC